MAGFIWRRCLCPGFIVSFLFFSFSAFCDEEKNIKEEIKRLKQRIERLEERLAGREAETAQNQQRDNKLDEVVKLLEGVRFGGGITFITQGTHNANGDGLSKNGDDVTDDSYSVDIEIEKKFSDYGKAYLHLEAGHGQGVTDELQVFSNVNADATGDENLDLIEAWYEHYFKNLPLTFTFGKIDATRYIDTNEYANDETLEFLGDIFKNSPALEFPDSNSVGIRLAAEPNDFLDIELVAMDANSDWEDVFDSIFFAGQINFKPNLFNKKGNYRIYGWLNDKNHIKWNDTAKIKEEGYGFGLSFDQELTGIVGIFMRYGWQNPKVYAEGADFSLEQSWGIGIQIAGKSWNRENDVFGIAFGRIIPSYDYKKFLGRKAEAEEHLEAYYKLWINRHFALSLDLQVIRHPYGDDAFRGDKTILIGGLRSQVDF